MKTAVSILVRMASAVGVLREASPLMHGDYDDEMAMRAQIAAYLEGRR